MKRKLKRSEKPHPKATLTIHRIGFTWRFILTAIGIAAVLGSVWEPVAAIHRGDATVFYLWFFLSIAPLIFVVGLFGYYPQPPEFNGFAPFTSSMLIEMGKTILYAMPLLLSSIAFDSWIESQGYELQYKGRQRSRLDRIWEPKVFLKVQQTQIQDKPQVGPNPTAEATPIHTRLPRQLILKYDIATDGPPSAARIQELMRMRGSVGLTIFGEMSVEEWQRFCAESAALPQPMELLSCEGINLGD